MTIHVGIYSDIPPQTRTVVMVGGKGCDHLRELVRMAEFQGRAAYRVESATELQPRWFAGVDDVGVVVGASYLAPQVEAVLEKLKHFSAAQAAGMLEGVAV
jgi:4-hydroxy-3-methylbut-2-enyl diphosphate reductase